MATRLESALAANANPARIVIAEGKVRIYNMSVKACPPWRAATRTRPTTAESCGEGGNASTLDVAKAIADYASS